MILTPVKTEEHNENIINAKRQIKKQIKRLEDKKIPNEKQSKPTFTNNALTIKLPEIQLPTLSGKLEEWSKLKLQFDNIILSNEQRSEAPKLHYLSAALLDEARVLIAT